jgi:anti-sigma regulatory factor (Ser/Thr protein kinase)
MKKITCFINDSKLLEKVKDFCEREKFELICMSGCDGFEYDVSVIIYITDNKNKLFLDCIKDTPVCYIGDKNDVDKSVICMNGSFEYIHLRYLVDAVTHSGCFENSASSVFPTSINKSFKIRNDIFAVEKIVYTLTKDFVYFLDFQSLEKIRVGLSEMLTNAIEHGNLRITGDDKMKATEEGSYYDLVNQRMADKDLMSKFVTFTYSVDSEGVMMQIEDEGEGFNVKELPDPTDPEGLLKLHGRGILITRMYFDELSYNDKGNKVTLKKRF